VLPQSILALVALSKVKLLNLTINMDFNDNRIHYTAALPEGTYHKFCSNVYSQNGEDGVIAQLFKELGITRGYVCEFGAADGKFSSNTYNLITTGNFNGLYIESDHVLYEKCKANFANLHAIGAK
jgi:hypothetical protein